MERKWTDWGGVILALILVVTVNWLANWLPIGGQATGEVSAKYGSLFTPAGFTFAIWGIIYLGLFAYAITQALPSQRNSETLSRIGRLFILSCIFNGCWMFAWHYEFIAISFLLMLGMLVSLIQIYRIIKNTDEKLSLAITLPFSLYVAWISVATIANFSSLQTALDANTVGMSFVNWTLLKLALAGAIGASVLLLKRDIAYVLVIGWAAYGISAKQIATPEVSGAAWTLTMVAIALAIFQLARSIMTRKNTDT
jgi:hypothetical protein